MSAIAAAALSSETLVAFTIGERLDEHGARMPAIFTATASHRGPWETFIIGA